jgi:hypothetical protein
MVKEKQISISIPVDTYSKLASLGDFYKVDIKKLISDLLFVIGNCDQKITDYNNEYKVPVDVNFILQSLLRLGHDSYKELFNAVLERLGVKGLFNLNYFEAKLDEMYFLFDYEALKNSNLYIDNFQVVIESGDVNITTLSYIDVKNYGKALRKLEKILKKIDAMDYSLPDELSDLELTTGLDYDDESGSLTIYFSPTSFEYAPKISSISKFIEHIFRKAGIIVVNKEQLKEIQEEVIRPTAGKKANRDDWIKYLSNINVIPVWDDSLEPFPVVFRRLEKPKGAKTHLVGFGKKTRRRVAEILNIESKSDCEMVREEIEF